MADFLFLVTDERYSVPNLRILEAATTAAARTLAERILAESGHHRKIEVWRDNERLFSLAAPPSEDEPTLGG
jgi:hypothetical protein